MAMCETGSDELTTLPDHLATYIGAGVRPTALPGPGHMQLPTRRAVWEVAIFPLFDVQTPPASAGTDPGERLCVHIVRQWGPAAPPSVR